MLLIYHGKKLFVIKTIYLDMDGVIADFDKGYNAIYGVFCRDDPVKSHWTEAVKNGIFESLELMPGAQGMIDYIFTLGLNVEILSSVSNRGDGPDVARQKEAWLNKHGLGELKRNFTPNKKSKGKYANQHSLLIDDSQECYDAFTNGGGYSILHKDSVDTIKQLVCMNQRGLLCVQ